MENIDRIVFIYQMIFCNADEEIFHKKFISFYFVISLLLIILYHKKQPSNCYCSLISVGKAPKILEELEDLVKTAPEKAVLECKIDSGDPKAEITWFRKDRQVSQ